MPLAFVPAARDEAHVEARAFDVVRAANLSKRFGPFWALRDASFSIRVGEILGLIGPNGSGKTTLFQCLAGVSPATLASIERDSTPISPDDRKRLLFYVPDGIRPWGDQSVEWSLHFIAGLYGASLLCRHSRSRRSRQRKARARSAIGSRATRG